MARGPCRPTSYLFASAILVLCCAPLSALPLDAVEPGTATVESMRAALGAPVGESTNRAYPMERYEAPQEGLQSVTAWYDEAFQLRWARIVLVNKLPGNTVRLLFMVEGQGARSEGNVFAPDDGSSGLTESFPQAGLHMWVADGVVQEVWRTAPGADTAEIRKALGEYAANAEMTLVAGAGEDETPPEDLPDDFAEPFVETADDEIVSPESLEPPEDEGAVEDEDADGEKPERPPLGVAVKALDASAASRLRVREGAYVVSTTPGSPADEAGLAAGDVITAFAGRRVSAPSDLARLVAESDPERHYRVDIVRGGRRTFVTVGPADDSAAEAEPRERGWLGAGVRSVNYQEARRAGLPGVEGAFVVSVTPGGPAEQGGLRANDFIVSWGGRKVANADDLTGMAGGTPPGREVAVVVVRSGSRRELRVTVGSRE